MPSTLAELFFRVYRFAFMFVSSQGDDTHSCISFYSYLLWSLVCTSTNILLRHWQHWEKYQHRIVFITHLAENAIIVKFHLHEVRIFLLSIDAIVHKPQHWILCFVLPQDDGVVPWILNVPFLLINLEVYELNMQIQPFQMQQF